VVKDRYHLIEHGHVEALRRVAKRLYTEMRMSGDEMRDAAHVLSAVADYADSMPVDLDDFKGA